MCNDNWFPRWIASVLACTVQSAICFTNGASHSTYVDPLSRTHVVQTESLENFKMIKNIMIKKYISDLNRRRVGAGRPKSARKIRGRLEVKLHMHGNRVS